MGAIISIQKEIVRLLNNTKGAAEELTLLAGFVNRMSPYEITYWPDEHIWLLKHKKTGKILVWSSL